MGMAKFTIAWLISGQFGQTQTTWKGDLMALWPPSKNQFLLITPLEQTVEPLRWCGGKQQPSYVHSDSHLEHLQAVSQSYRIVCISRQLWPIAKSVFVVNACFLFLERFRVPVLFRSTLIKIEMNAIQCAKWLVRPMLLQVIGVRWMTWLARLLIELFFSEVRLCGSFPQLKLSR